MKKISVVIVEDNYLMSEMISDSLKDDNYIEVVGIAQNGEDGYRLIASLQPDIVLLDLILPKMDGFEIIEKARQNYIKSKFLISSSLSEDFFIRKALNYGASYYLIKPYTISILKERIMDIYGQEIKPIINNNIEKVDVQNNNNIVVEKYDNQTLDKISNVLISVGIPANIVGYKFLRDAINMSIASDDRTICLTKQLYPDIALKYGTTAGGVERAIRHAIDVAWNRGKLENINSIFGVHIYSKRDKPTNGEFIALVTDRLLTKSI